MEQDNQVFKNSQKNQNFEIQDQNIKKDINEKYSQLTKDEINKEQNQIDDNNNDNEDKYYQNFTEILQDVIIEDNTQQLKNCELINLNAQEQKLNQHTDQSNIQFQGPSYSKKENKKKVIYQMINNKSYNNINNTSASKQKIQNDQGTKYQGLKNQNQLDVLNNFKYSTNKLLQKNEDFSQQTQNYQQNEGSDKHIQIQNHTSFKKIESIPQSPENDNVVFSLYNKNNSQKQLKNNQQQQINQTNKKRSNTVQNYSKKGNEYFNSKQNLDQCQKNNLERNSVSNRKIQAQKKRSPSLQSNFCNSIILTLDDEQQINKDNSQSPITIKNNNNISDFKFRTDQKYYSRPQSHQLSHRTYISNRKINHKLSDRKTIQEKQDTQNNDQQQTIYETYKQNFIITQDPAKKNTFLENQNKYKKQKINLFEYIQMMNQKQIKISQQKESYINTERSQNINCNQQDKYQQNLSAFKQYTNQQQKIQEKTSSEIINNNQNIQQNNCLSINNLFYQEQKQNQPNIISKQKQAKSGLLGSEKNEQKQKEQKSEYGNLSSFNNEAIRNLTCFTTQYDKINNKEGRNNQVNLVNKKRAISLKNEPAQFKNLQPNIKDQNNSSE
ncbi:hypothetical protein PPERSA_09766 [Pseudocohnilembus persalinus]|uniref:Uncharacterized protein n=1 Tax=Pseudocohnilembus persalinus TaxID=266149 RepID=A0A0V0QUC8_PSEPJ|nr:hypothetical protein PPERSA_09766 [Pseudocohnilembus persalinus]|eukprot:KRX05626.1 hypothetical protein PPERSA_09766 [Pseudocohnilembus persalinus]